MKVTLLLLLLSSCYTLSASANKEICCPDIVNSTKGNYQFTEFREGKVYFKNGKYTSAKLNYNYLHGAIEFINASKDTLVMTNKGRIDYIAVGETVFYSQGEAGEIEFVADYGNILLAKKTHLVLKGNKSNASDQKYSANPDSGTPTSLLISNQTGEFRWENTASKPDYKYKTDYYIIDQNRIFHLAKRTSLMKIYSRQKNTLAEYLKKTNVDFDNEAQLRELLQFCSTM